jgi:GH43 family beta-xylosidase
MKLSDINIRDPFVLKEGDTYYLYGTRAKDFGKSVGGFDVYTSKDLVEFSEPIECFNSQKAGLNRDVNWAPEVHKYKGKYYMFCTFTKENGLRGVHILVSDSPLGEFKLHSNGAVTPNEWECLDGTLYVNKKGEPYLVFCHEHTQIIDGTVCYVRLSDDLTHSIGESKYMFSGSTPSWADKKPQGEHYITDGPFMYRTKSDELMLIWSTFVNHMYCQCIAKSSNGELDGEFIHLPPMITNDGGHGMLFHTDDELLLTFHTPNQTGFERPTFRAIDDLGDRLVIKA